MNQFFLGLLIGVVLTVASLWLTSNYLIDYAEEDEFRRRRGPDDI